MKTMVSAIIFDDGDKKSHILYQGHKALGVACAHIIRKRAASGMWKGISNSRHRLDTATPQSYLGADLAAHYALTDEDIANCPRESLRERLLLNRTHARRVYQDYLEGLKEHAEFIENVNKIVAASDDEVADIGTSSEGGYFVSLAYETLISRTRRLPLRGEGVEFIRYIPLFSENSLDSYGSDHFSLISFADQDKEKPDRHYYAYVGSDDLARVSADFLRRMRDSGAWGDMTRPESPFVAPTPNDLLSPYLYNFYCLTDEDIAGVPSKVIHKSLNSSRAAAQNTYEIRVARLRKNLEFWNATDALIDASDEDIPAVGRRLSTGGFLPLGLEIIENMPGAKNPGKFKIVNGVKLILSDS